KEGVVARKDGNANRIKAAQEGAYAVTVAASSAVEGKTFKTATCSFAAKKVVPPAPTCDDTEKSIGGHLAFLIDNSNSNAATDCPEKTRIGTHAGTDIYECGAQTN